MREADFQDQVIELAQIFQWRVHHDRPARTNKGYRTAIIGDAGFPDLVLVRPPRLVVAELKADAGRVTHAQEGWLLACSQNPGVEVYLWRPDDIDAIADNLSLAHMGIVPLNLRGRIGQGELAL